MKQKRTQINAIKILFLTGMKLNWLNTFKLTGCSSIGRRVSDLRQFGWVIKGERVTFKTRYGTQGSYMNYQLDKKKTPKHLLKCN